MSEILSMEVSILITLEVPDNEGNKTSKHKLKSLVCFVDDCWTAVGLHWVCIEADSIPGSLAGLVVFRRYQREIVTWLCHNVQLRMEKQSMQLSCVGSQLCLFINVYHVCLVPHSKVELRTREVAPFIAATLTWQLLYETAFIFRRWKVELAGIGSFAGICSLSCFISKMRSKSGEGISKSR